MTAPTTADVLRKALDVLRERGWAQGNKPYSADEVCAATSFMGLAHNAMPAVRLLAAIMHEHWPERLEGQAGYSAVSDVACWNDHPDTTQDDVERAFEKAIARAEEMVE